MDAQSQTLNTVDLSNLLLLETERQDRREQWLRQLLKNPLLNCTELMTPFTSWELTKAGRNEQTILLCLDQSEIGKIVNDLFIINDDTLTILKNGYQ